MNFYKIFKKKNHIYHYGHKNWASRQPRLKIKSINSEQTEFTTVHNLLVFLW